MTDEQIGQILERLERLTQHEPGCPAIADDESDYEHLDDAGICVCDRRQLRQLAYLTPKCARTWKEAFEVEQHDRREAEAACARLRTALEGLIEKWHAAAKGGLEAANRLREQQADESAAYERGKSDVRLFCADDLAAALSLPDDGGGQP